MSQPLLRALQVGRRLAEIEALAPTDLELVPGETVALVGPNGAGKSTLLAILAGAIEASQGKVETHARVGWVPQRPAHYGRLTARENLRLFAALEEAPAARADELHDRFELPDGVRAAELSVGNRQRLDVAISLVAAPRVLLLDEPTASLDPIQRQRLWEIARRVREDGGAVLVATHHWEELEGRADRTLELREGRLQ